MYRTLTCELIHHHLKNNLFHDKAKPFVRRGRKATDLKEIAGLPGFGREAGLPWKQGGSVFLVYGPVAL